MFVSAQLKKCIPVLCGQHSTRMQPDMGKTTAIIVILAFCIKCIAGTSSCPPQYLLIPVQYSVQFPSDACRPAPGSDSPSSSPITVAVPAGSTAVDVMTGAIDIDRRYRFQATSFGRTLGFFIDAIGGTSSSSGCYWSFLIKERSAPARLSNVGVSSYSICSEVSIILSYTTPGHNDNADSSAACDCD